MIRADQVATLPSVAESEEIERACRALAEASTEPAKVIAVWSQARDDGVAETYTCRLIGAVQNLSHGLLDHLAGLDGDESMSPRPQVAAC